MTKLDLPISIFADTHFIQLILSITFLFRLINHILIRDILIINQDLALDIYQSKQTCFIYFLGPNIISVASINILVMTFSVQKVSKPKYLSSYILCNTDTNILPIFFLKCGNELNCAQNLFCLQGVLWKLNKTLGVS